MADREVEMGSTRARERALRACGVLTLLLVAWARPAAATVAFIQGGNADPSSSASVSVTLSAAQAAGDLNLVIVGFGDNISKLTSITDTRGNQYTLAAGATTSAGHGVQVIYYAKSIAAAAAGANTVTVKFTGTVLYPDVRVVEYSGLDPNNPLDVAIGASGTGTAVNSGVITTTNANDLLVGADYIGAGFTAVGSGYTQRIVTNPDADLVEDRIVAATGSYSATSTQSPSSWWVMQMVALRAAGSGGGSSSSSGSSTSSSSSSSSSGSSTSSSSSSSSSG
jgi:hypothetical protein